MNGMRSRVSRRIRQVATIGLALVVTTAPGCRSQVQPPAATPPAESTAAPPEAGGTPLALRTYDVPETSLPPLLSLLRTLLQGGDTPVGRVDVVPGNRVAVLAPERIQEGVAALLAEVAADPGGIPPVLTYDVDHWLVVGRPAPETSTTGPLSDLTPALDAITSTQGPTEFALLEHLRMRSMDHQQAEIEGVYGGVRQEIAREQGQLVSELSVRAAGSEWRTRLSIEPEQLIVLAQVGFQHPLPHDPFSGGDIAEGTGAQAPGPREWEPAARTNLYHILRIRIDAGEEGMQ